MFGTRLILGLTDHDGNFLFRFDAEHFHKHAAGIEKSAAFIEVGGPYGIVKCPDFVENVQYLTILDALGGNAPRALVDFVHRNGTPGNVGSLVLYVSSKVTHKVRAGNPGGKPQKLFVGRGI